MGTDREQQGKPRKVWETPRVIAVERIPEVLGVSCVAGSTPSGTPPATPCMFGGRAIGRCSIGSRVSAPFQP